MLCRTASMLLISAASACSAAEPTLSNSQTVIRALAAGGAYTGFDVLARAGGGVVPIAEVRWSSGGRWTCARAEVAGRSLRFADFAAAGTATPTLAEETGVEVNLERDDPFPRVTFRLSALTFDEAAWRAAWQNACPLYFLRCSLPASAAPQQLLYQGGELYPGPDLDPYVITMGPMRGDWSPRWSYAPALGAAPIPAVGLWAPESRLFVAYEFQSSRLTDRSDLNLASSYCAGLPDHPGQFFALSHPHADQWLSLRLPVAPFTVGTSFRLLYHQDMPADGDPNRFVINHLLAHYGEALPAAPRMNDMSWLRQGLEPSQQLFLHDLGLAKDYPRQRVAPTLWRPYEACEKQFFDPGTVQLAAHQTGKAARYAWTVGDSAGLAELRRELDYLVLHAKEERFGADVCTVWEHPVEGQFKESLGGRRATCTRHMFNWGIASAMLWFYRQERATAYLPYLDGMVRWTRHYLYDRAGMADLPWAVFSMGAANGGEFLLDYYYTFRDDPERGALAEEAWRLAPVVVYRNTYHYTGDPDASDVLDPTFLLQAVNSHYWLGQVTWGEMGRLPEMAIQMYLETGDPFFRYLTRGCLERFYLGTIDASGHYTENLSIFGETGRKGTTSGGWGANNFRWLTEPLGGAILQVDVGPQGALAFCRGTKAIDIADYAFAPEASYAFTLTVDAALPGAPAGPFDIMVTSPRRSLAGAVVALNGQPLPRERYVVGTAATDALIRGVCQGDRVFIGAAGATPRPITLRHLLERAAFAVDHSGRFAFVDLTRLATAPLDDTWTGDWGGLIPGRMDAANVPFCLIDPAANRGKGAVPLTAGVTLKLRRGLSPLVVVLGAPHALPDDAECAHLRLTYADSTGADVSLRSADGIVVQHGMEWYAKDWWLRAFAVGRDHARLRSITLQGPALLLALSIPTEPAVADVAKLRTAIAEAQLLALRQRQRQAYQLEQTATERAPIDAPWWDERYRYRFLLRLDPVVPLRHDAIIRLRERFGVLFEQAGLRETLAPATLRAVACDEQGRATGEVGVQFSGRGTVPDQGELLLRLPGEWTSPRWIAVYFGTIEKPAPPSAAAPALTVQRDGTLLRCASGQARLAFELAGEAAGPRLVELGFGTGPNLLAKAGWDEGFGHLCACQDGVTWYDFGALQNTAASADVIDHGPLALTVRVRGLELYGAGQTVTIQGVGTDKPTGAAVKGSANWMFRLYADDPRVDSWLEYDITDPDTHWTRPLEVRYGVADSSGARNGEAEQSGVAYASEGGLCLIGLDEEGEAPATPYCTGVDGNVLGVRFSRPAFPAAYRTDKWRALPAGLSREAMVAEAAPAGIEQYGLETRRDGQTERPIPRPVEAQGASPEMDMDRVWSEPGVPSFRAGQPDLATGLMNRDNPDEGTSLREQVDGRWCVVPGKGPDGGLQSFVYFALATPLAAPPQGQPAYVMLEYFDRGAGSVTFEYDSADATVRKSSSPGAFKEAEARLVLSNSHQWRTQVFACPDARFARRCNGADFRLAVGTGSLAIARVAVVLPSAGAVR